jgi:hypothetical protein
VLLEDAAESDDPARLQAVLEKATDVALAPWMR